MTKRLENLINACRDQIGYGVNVLDLSDVELEFNNTITNDKDEIIFTASEIYIACCRIRFMMSPFEEVFEEEDRINAFKHWISPFRHPETYIKQRVITSVEPNSILFRDCKLARTTGWNRFWNFIHEEYNTKW